MSVIVLPEAKVGEAYSVDLTTLDTPYDTFEVTGLPAGLSYADGVISGTPEEPMDGTVQIVGRHSTQVDEVDFSTPVPEVSDGNANFYYKTSSNTTVNMRTNAAKSMITSYGGDQDYLTINDADNGGGRLTITLNSTTFDFGYPSPGVIEEEKFPLMVEVKVRFSQSTLPETWDSDFNVIDVTNTYSIRAKVGGTTSIYKNEQIAAVDINLLDGEWHTIGLYLEFDRDQRVYIDGQSIGDPMVPLGDLMKVFTVAVGTNNNTDATARLHIKHAALYNNLTDTQRDEIAARQGTGVDYRTVYTPDFKVVEEDVEEEEQEEDEDEEEEQVDDEAEKKQETDGKDDDDEKKKKKNKTDVYYIATIVLGVVAGVALAVVAILAIMLAKK